MGKLDGKKVAILFTDGVEQVELDKPAAALRDEGADAVYITLEPGEVQAFNHLDHGDKIQVDNAVKDADASDYDALMLPGGVANPDFLRMDQDAVKFVGDFVAQKKPVAAICHGPWTLVEADVLKGRTITSWPSLKTDIRNAGGTWVDEEVHVDEGLVSSRKPDDIPAFNAKMIEEFAEGEHERMSASASGARAGSAS
jgi:protease I